MVSGQGKRLRYAADEAPPPGVSVVVGLQTAVLTCVPVVVIMTIVARVAGQSDEYLLWTIFAGLVIGGLTTIVQAARFGGIGAGNLVIMGSCGAAIGRAARRCSQPWSLRRPSSSSGSPPALRCCAASLPL